VAEIINELDRIEAAVMDGLKDFQRATVERIDQLYRAGQRRILVSDEVGLGKTLIARGTVAKLATLRAEEGDKLFKVVYVCSNAAIAGQNLNKLRISKELRTEETSSSRLSMQHLKIFRQEHDPDLLSRYIQLIPLTPDTSFHMTSRTGSVEERALMYAILKRIPELELYLYDLEVALRDYADTSWKNWAKDWYEKQVLTCDGQTKGAYLRYMVQEVSLRAGLSLAGEKSCMERLIILCKKVAQNGHKRVSETQVIGDLRVLFAHISVDLLKPDFVIMDEFQRFKYLIDSDEKTETGMLARRFFEGGDVRMLLLSATPYKMYSTLEEISELAIDEHYNEFFKVMDFLKPHEEDRLYFHEVWRNYSMSLRELSRGDMVILEAKTAAEDALYASICRTERISAKESADIVDDSSVRVPLKPMAADIRSYIQLQQLLDDIGLGAKVPVDYVKSAPYLLSFMRDYQLKREIERYFKQHPDELGKANKDCLWLRRNNIENFEKLEPMNAKLDSVTERVFSQNAEKLLWVPPSKPYYELSGAFSGAEDFSKTLVFSSWEMVPRMLAAMLSYESERRNAKVILSRSGQNQKEVKYFTTGSKRYPPARLNFSVSLGDLKGMPLFCLLYPSETLAECYDPIDSLNRGLKLRNLTREIETCLSDKLRQLDRYEGPGRVDDRWYYLAPMLMDSHEYLDAWLSGGSSLAFYTDEEGGEQAGESSKGKKGFKAHIAELEGLLSDTNMRLGRKPADLLEVLTNMAMASPAVCIYRTYSRITAALCYAGYTADMPSQVAKVFINRMNTPEATAVIEAYYGQSEDAHWKNVLAYCKDGNLQAVVDEYAHVLFESNGFIDAENSIALLHGLIIESMNVHTASYNIDTFNSFRSKLEGRKSQSLSIRSHFAVAFTKSDSKAGQDADRKETVRNSFNSPFRPFVLATTSIGQEGLDFHYYCRRIVHWNLPSNPIDLEQREGRINRFKCLAIRQNIAKRYGCIQFEKDIWAEMFGRALLSEKAEKGSELIPYWGLSPTEDMIKIERIVPMYPFSRDIAAYERLMKILSLYRLTLGQPRQEELLEYLIQNQQDNVDVRDYFMNLSPFYKNVSSSTMSEQEEKVGNL
jgi:hypothetical protein